MVSTWLPHRVAAGYSTPVTQILRAVNGTRITNIAMLVETLRGSKSDFMRLSFEDEHTEMLVFKRTEIENATGDLMMKYAIPRRASVDLLKIWTGNTANKELPAIFN